ncbi:hypothetical protein Ahy_B08g092369 [Arachis hypogaea]|uniref:Zinc finger PMZ-type domain-containing protein n=1 Tax=Arachis hypogaea TaxID=3818 RepID=A0A444Y3S6_ARAHY|nr:hypothetical protein Ahy_B08g092369 [Arachis hypogaea]
MSRLPCPHAISCITFKGLDMESFVDDHYKKDAYLRCYQEVIHPLNGPDLWERIQYDDVMPQPYRTIGGQVTSQLRRGSEDLRMRITEAKLTSFVGAKYKDALIIQPAIQQAGKGPKRGPALPQCNPKAPSTQPLPKKSSAAASSTSKKNSHNQPTDRKRHFSVIQIGAPHIPMQKLKLMAKLPPSAWGNL